MENWRYGHLMKLMKNSWNALLIPLFAEFFSPELFVIWCRLVCLDSSVEWRNCDRFSFFSIKIKYVNSCSISVLRYFSFFLKIGSSNCRYCLQISPAHCNTTKVCTILVWYYIEGANQENESGFLFKKHFFIFFL